MRKETIIRYLEALGQTGKHTDAFFYIEEKLTGEEAEQLQIFIGSLGDNKAPLGPANIEAKMKIASKAVPRVQAIYQRKFDEMAKAVSIEVFRKHDAFADEVLKPGRSIDLHEHGYPFKGCEVVSYDPETKLVTLKVK